MLRGLDQLMERKEGGGMYLLWVPLIGDVRTLMMDEAHALSYHSSIQCAPFEALFRRKCRSPVLVEVGDKVMLEVSSWKDVLHFGKKDLLAPRYYWTDANLHVHLEEIKVDKTLRFAEEPVEIIDREVKSLKRSRIPIVKSIGTRSESCYAVIRTLVWASEVVSIKSRDEISLRRGYCDNYALSRAATIDFPQQIQDRILESQLVDDLKMKLSGIQEENDKLKRVSIKSSQLLEYEKLLEYDGFKSSFFQVRGSIPREQIDDLSYKSRLSIFEHEDMVWMLIMKWGVLRLQYAGHVLAATAFSIYIYHPLNDGTSSSSSDTKISHLPTSLVDKALTISHTYDVTDALDSPERPGPMDWQNLMSGQPATSTWNSLDEQRGVLRLQSAGHVLAATAFSTYICLVLSHSCFFGELTTDQGKISSIVVAAIMSKEY
ncbi:hypothetical protein Tco_0452094 [Tanacetum coccineum]